MCGPFLQLNLLKYGDMLESVNLFGADSFEGTIVEDITKRQR
jgi:hypothetical protein